ncbi:hypothetical protein BH11MYX1_BH11MYX1_45850 [soil metagenome]
MARATDPISNASPAPRKSAVDVMTFDAVAIVDISGLVDENFTGFGKFESYTKVVVIDASKIVRMTSFGVRQWLKAMDAMPKTVTDLYLLGCPTFFVDQLNMVLNFGGAAQILTVVAPYTCASCGQDSGEIVDVMFERAVLANGSAPEKTCSRCSAKLEFDETPESYFSFVSKYAAATIDPAAAQLLALRGLYVAAIDAPNERPPRIIKLVRGSVTYFRISGTIGATFRARPFLVGAEGEIVLDLADVVRFDPASQREWRRLLKSLSTHVTAITLVDVSDSFLAVAGDSVTTARNISVWSTLVPYVCSGCQRESRESQRLQLMEWPPTFPDQVCSTCGATMVSTFSVEPWLPLRKAGTESPPASTKLIEQRAEVLSRELTDANVAQAGENATVALSTDDTILGKYKIVRRLSAGGMAEVFLAKQIGIGGFEKPVALKRIQRQLLERRHLAIDMFLNEAKIAGRLIHPNIVQVLDVGEVAGALYLAMEYVRGKDLRDVTKQLQSTGAILPLGEICFIIREVAQALHHAYWSTDMSGARLSVVHRDVSPHNIIVSFEGAVKLLDFGVAMSSVTEQTESMVVGKWQYMSPEHTTNQSLDHRSDLFSLGIVLYLLCANVLPFTGVNQRDIVRKIRAGEYTPIEQHVQNVPEGIKVLIAQMLAPNPEDRPQTGNEVAAVLTEIARSYGLERSPADVARFLAEMFPTDFSETFRPSALMSATKLGVGAGSMDSLTQSSVTPSGMAPTPWAAVPAAPPMPMSPPPPPPAVHVAAPAGWQRADSSVDVSPKLPWKMLAFGVAVLVLIIVAYNLVVA